MDNQSPRLSMSSVPGSPVQYSPTSRVQDARRKRRSALALDPSHLSPSSPMRAPTPPDVPEISTHDPTVSSPRHKQLPDIQKSSRSSHYRSSVRRSEFISPPTSPLAEISENGVPDDNRFSSAFPTRNIGPPEMQGSSPHSSPHRSTHRTSQADFISAPYIGPSPESLRRISVQPRQKILFYHRHDPHYGFTNFSDHPVIYKGKKYSTSEHLFQSFKFHDHRPGLAEHIRTCSERPSVAFSEARRFQPEVRPDWKYVNIDKMDIALELKFTQHADLKAELLATGDAELVEDSDKDAFWGVGADGTGRNELGKALERLRERLGQL